MRYDICICHTSPYSADWKLPCPHTKLNLDTASSDEWDMSYYTIHQSYSFFFGPNMYWFSQLCGWTHCPSLCSPCPSLTAFYPSPSQPQNFPASWGSTLYRGDCIWLWQLQVKPITIFFLGLRQPRIFPGRHPLIERLNDAKEFQDPIEQETSMPWFVHWFKKEIFLTEPSYFNSFSTLIKSWFTLVMQLDRVGGELKPKTVFRGENQGLSKIICVQNWLSRFVCVFSESNMWCREAYDKV